MFQITPQRVEKEDILELKFPKKPLELSLESKKHLCQAIKKASAKGKKKKVKIIFYDTTGIKEVETAVLTSTESEVVINQNIIIPINRVVEVKSA